MKKILVTSFIIAATVVLIANWDQSIAVTAHASTSRIYSAMPMGQLDFGRMVAQVKPTSSPTNSFVQVGVVGQDSSTSVFNFGSAVAVDNDTAIIGAPDYDHGELSGGGVVYIYTRTDGLWQQKQILVEGHGGPSGLIGGFGAAVAIEGNVAVVGAPGVDTVLHSDQGAAYVYVRSADGWKLSQKLEPSDGNSDGHFGAAVAIDGTTILVGAPGEYVKRFETIGGTYVFVLSNGTWSQQKKLVSDDGAGDMFGSAVALNGNTALVGAYLGSDNENGAAYVYIRNGATWSLQQKLTVQDGWDDEYFGSAVALDGDTALIGAASASNDVTNALDQGAAYIFERSGGVWNRRQKLVASDGGESDYFGVSVSLSGDTALIGAKSGMVVPSVSVSYVFVRIGNTWVERQKLGTDIENNPYLFDPAVALEGNTAILGGSGQAAGGRAYFFERTSLKVTKAYSPDSGATSGSPPTSVRITLTTSHGLASVSVTDTIPSGLEFVAGSLTSMPSGAVLDPGNSRRILWNGVVSPASPVTIQYQAALNSNVEPGSVLGSEVVATTNSGDHYSVQASLAVEDHEFSGALMLVYIGADNAVDGFNVGQGDLSDEALRLMNQAELKANTPGVRTIVMLDGPGDEDARIYNLKYDEDLSCPNFQNPYCAGRPIPYVEGVNTFSWGDSVANPTSLAEFVIKASLANPKASTVLLSLVGHGGGWSPELLKGQPTKHGGQPTKHGGQPTKRGGQPEDAETELAGGLLWDVQPSDGLSTADVATALGWVRDATGKKVDLLYLDACLMAMSEVAYELRNGADFLLASESWSWTAFPYDQHIADAGTILASGAAAPAKAIGEAWLGNEVAALSEEDNYPFTVSLTDLSKMPSLVAAQNQLADALITAFDVNDAQTRQRMDDAFVVTECVDSDQSGRIEHDAAVGWDDNYCDLGTFATAVMQGFGDNASVVVAAQKVRTALAETVIASEFRSGIPHTYSELPWNWRNLTGLTIYMPLRQDDWKRRYYNDLFLPSSVDSRWGALLTRYWQGVSQPDPTAHPDPVCPETGCGMVPAPLPVGSIKVVATPHDSGIRLEWWVSPDASAVVQYDIQRVLLPLANAPDPVTTIANPVPAPPQPYVYSDASAERGKEYCYQVIATSSTGGALAYSNFACATHAMPSAPSISAPTVSVTSTGILVEWDAVQMASTAAGYRLYRSTNRGPRLPLADTLFSASQFLDEAVWQGVEYCYKVHAIGQNGELQATSGEACTSLGVQPQFFFLPAVNR